MYRIGNFDYLALLRKEFTALASFQTLICHLCSLLHQLICDIETFVSQCGQVRRLEYTLYAAPGRVYDYNIPCS